LQDKIDNRVTAQAIGKYERNEDMPTSGVLIALARALGVSVDYLIGEQEIALEDVDFRKKQQLGRREQAKLEARVIHLLERYLTVESTLRLPSVDWDKPREAPYPVLHDIREADRAARSLRIHWGLGVEPVPSLVELLEERGIKVLSLDDEKIDGMIAKVRRQSQPESPVVVINCKDWSERKRFNLAHEVGHLVMDVAERIDAEKAAHRFAGAFLMPAEAMWAEIGKERRAISIGELAKLKERFGASLQAIVYRCKDLGIIGDRLFRDLFNHFEERGWRHSPYEEPGALSPKLEEPRRLERLCFRALAENLISESKAAEILGLSVRELSQKMDEPDESPSIGHLGTH
jgi:Zn-dependent peptidase ImmA (M78 family)/transcriptional regulator with XRE-family HTH domain